jgi:hypothetical protein
MQNAAGTLLICGEISGAQDTASRKGTFQTAHRFQMAVCDPPLLEAPKRPAIWHPFASFFPRLTSPKNMANVPSPFLRGSPAMIAGANDRKPATAPPGEN